MSVTPIDRPEVLWAKHFFATEDEAQMFAQAVREDLANEEFFDFVGYEVYDGGTSTFYPWIARIDYIDRTPPADEAA